jgi:hypothetical protein
LEKAPATEKNQTQVEARSMIDFKTWLTEGEIKNRTMTLYHGVKNADNVKKILDGGFKLIYIKPNWINDYAVSAAKSKAAVMKFFGNRPNIIVLKFKFKGKVWKGDQWDSLKDEVGSIASSPQQLTRDIVKAGIDASDQGYVYIYNPKKISNIEVA